MHDELQTGTDWNRLMKDYEEGRRTDGLGLGLGLLLNTAGETNRSNQEKLISLPSHQSHERNTTTHPKIASRTTTLHGYAEYLTPGYFYTPQSTVPIPGIISCLMIDILNLRSDCPSQTVPAYDHLSEPYSNFYPTPGKSNQPCLSYLSVSKFD